ncbi:MAG: TRAP transporter small permease [Alphaproteobacteria bacterium]|nr:TRAP transporter small permease [Alphaproteobacteria bacterium]
MAGAVGAAAAGLLRRAVAAVAAALRWSLIAAVAVMVACIGLQVVMRYAFGRALSWTEELALLMFAWSTLGGLALGVREGFHVRLTALLDPLPPALRRAADAAIDLLTAALGFYLLWSGWRYVDITAGATSAAVGYPIELLHGLSPVAGALMLVFAAERAVLGAHDVSLAAGDAPP